MIWTTRPRSEFGELRAIRSGNGPTVVLLHGVGLRAEAWAAQIDALSAEFEVIAPDMAGHGASPCLSGPVGLSRYSDQVADALGASAHIIGHSMGGYVALALAEKEAQLFNGLCLMNSTFPIPPRRSRPQRYLRCGRRRWSHFFWTT